MCKTANDRHKMIYKNTSPVLRLWVFCSFISLVRAFYMSVLGGPLIRPHLRHVSQLENQTYLGDGSVTQDVIWTRGLLDPQRFELSQAGHPADGLGYVPPLVGINHLTQKHFSMLPFPDVNIMIEKRPHQSVIGSNHLPYEAAPARVVLEISADFHLELSPAALQCICAELQKHTVKSYTKVIWVWFGQRLRRRDLFELLVWVSDPCAGGGVGRITLLQHLILWQAEETVHTGNKHSRRSVL